MFAFQRFVMRRLVIINLRTGSAVRGYPVSQSGPLIVLKGASVSDNGGEFVEVDGEVIIERSNVDFIQAVGGELWSSSKGRGALPA